MQNATVLPIGTAGIALPDSVLAGSVGAHPPVAFGMAELVTLDLRVPALNAGTHTIATSGDDGATWVTEAGAIALTGNEPANPTGASSTGSWRALYGPYLPGTMFRITSSVPQTAVCSMRFGV